MEQERMPKLEEDVLPEENMIDNNSEAETPEEQINNVVEAIEDAEDDKPATESATPAEETTEE